MIGLRRLLRGGVRLGAAPLAAAFERALHDPEAAQRAVRDGLARRAMRSAYGRHHGLTHAEAFRERLPVVTPEDLAPWLARLEAGEQGVLADERVALFEPTSGSSGRAKLIPYPPALRRAFARMFLLWVHDLLGAFPTLGDGRCYVSVSPSWGPPRRTAGGHAVGLETDADYLGGWLSRALDPFLVTVPGVARLPDAAAFRDATARALLAARDLQAVSVWNPSFLTALLDHIEDHRAALAATPGLPAPTRAALSAGPVAWEAVWPALRLVSCWADAQAGLRAAELAGRLPGVRLQPKGLLATEGPVTVPREGVVGGVPLLTEVYLEFEAADGRLRELHELAEGESYGLLLSQPGGLYRYRLGDEVRVASRLHATPTLAFVGRGAAVSDLVGEKLAEAFLRAHVAPLLPPEARVATFVPVRRARDGYVLLLDRCEADPAALAARVEAALREAHHYGLARDLGQLAPLAVACRPDAEACLTAFLVRQGLKLGDIKPALLLTRAADEGLSAALG